MSPEVRAQLSLLCFWCAKETPLCSCSSCKLERITNSRYVLHVTGPTGDPTIYNCDASTLRVLLGVFD